MATTDYNKLKQISPTSQNDSGATFDKAQPIQVIGEVTPKEFDGFEDGDFTSNPQWTETETNGTATVQSTTVKNGSNALELSSSGAGDESIQHDRGSGGGSISDGDIYQCWIRQDSQNDSVAFSLTNTSNDRTGNDSIGFNMSANGNLDAFTGAATGGISESSTLIDGWSTNTWYRLVVKINPSTSEAFFRIYDSSDNLIAKTTLGTTGATNIRYIWVGKEDFGSSSVFYDDVSYSTTDSGTTEIGEDKTGNGYIVTDWSNISSESDIAIYDQNGNLLPYEIESFDATAESAVLWCYDSWVRDDTSQGQIVYGDGPASSEENVTGTWNNTGQNAVMVQHLQDDPLTATDSTSNNNDGTVTGAVSTSGQFDGAASFDGTDDYITIGEIGTFWTEFTIVTWQDTDNDHNGIMVSGDDNSAGERVFQWKKKDTGTLQFIELDSTNETIDTASSISNNEFHHSGITYDDANTTGEIYVDGSLNNSDSSFAINDTGVNPQIVLGQQEDGSGINPLDGTMDEVRIYSEKKDSSWWQADYDASPKAGQVFFSQSAAESTLVEETDTATKANATSTTLTSTELNTFTDTATKASGVSTSLQTVETSSATDTVARANGVSTALTTTETFDTTDAATKASGISSALTSTEVEVLVDTVTRASAVSTALTTTEALPITDNVTKANAVSSTVTTTEVQGLVDTVVKATSTSTGLTTVEISSATDTATKADAVSTALMSDDQVARIATATKASAVSSTITASETILQAGPDITYPLSVNEDSMAKFIKDL